MHVRLLSERHSKNPIKTLTACFIKNRTQLNYFFQEGIMLINLFFNQNENIAIFVKHTNNWEKQ